MIQAELKGKIPELENSEDILTSCIFGLLRYLPLQEGLFEILKKTKNYDDNSSILDNNQEIIHYNEAEYFFWEASESYGKPDLILIFKSHDQIVAPAILVIEVKYYSEKSRSGEHDQLKDYFLALSDENSRKTFYNEKISEFKGKFLGLVYLTYYSQEKECEDSLYELSKCKLDDVKKNFYQLRWNDISKVIKKRKSAENDEYRRKIFEDLYELMLRKNFIDFEGWSNPIDVELNRIFFNAFSIQDIPENVLRTLKEYHGIVFYKGA